MSLTNHVWDGFWIIANGAAWKRLPEDVQNVANTVFSEKAVLQRADLVTLNQSLVDQLKSKGLAVNSTETDPSVPSSSRQASMPIGASKSETRHGPRLEHYTGPLG